MIYIYNSKTSQKEKFIPVNNPIRMYVCGVTVYNDIHIGNARPIIFFEFVRRFFELSGYKIIYVSNITDIDDKIINKAIELNIPESEVANKNIIKLKQNIIDLVRDLPDKMPKATDYIPNMIIAIQKLLDLGFAYIDELGVYFIVSKLKCYGELVNYDLNAVLSGTRIDVSEKNNANDFILWKFTNVGIKYDAPFGAGRPGWHTECAVMNDCIWPGMIDIHGGGVDLKFPHHTNETAQTKVLYNHDLANYFMHVGMINFDHKKMSKSLGNVILVKDIIKNKQTNALIYLFLQGNYKTPLNFTWEILEKSSYELNKIKLILKKALLKLKINQVTTNNLSNEIISEFVEKVADDFNTANGFMVIQKYLKEISRIKNLEQLSVTYHTIIYLLKVMLIEFNISITSNELEKYQKWLELKECKLYEEADQLRLDLINLGLI